MNFRSASNYYGYSFECLYLVGKAFCRGVNMKSHQAVTCNMLILSIMPAHRHVTKHVFTNVNVRPHSFGRSPTRRICSRV